MDSFDVNKLEWFLILLHIDQLSCMHPIKSPINKCSTDIPTLEKDTLFGAISNLQSQLGMESESIINKYALNSTISTEIEPFFNLSSIPIGHEAFMLVSKTNQLVTKAGELVDIWLSLVAGQQLSNMMLRTHTKQLEADCFSSNHEPYTASGTDEITSETRLLSSKVQKERLEWRAADFDQCYGYADHYTTFMGYKMEYARSFIAFLYGSFGNDETIVNSFFSTSSFTSINLDVSNTCWTDRNGFSVKKLQNRAAKCDLVWQLQKKIEEKLDNIWGQLSNEKKISSETNDNGREEMLMKKKDEISTFLASLFVLSFPSLSVEIFDGTASSRDSSNKGAVITFYGPAVRIKTALGPQDIQLELKMEEDNSLTLSIFLAKQKDWIGYVGENLS